ncbi:MAG: heme exporter protein CcmD [Proteobacteria bacterium]|nr:heme exporter protein CcmD [Pseudomonadota bacterium]MBS0462910.1 heme exporter protein CcmD [Pseudomonadota bacterium]MBS0463555.1 heme exporter protein CcmD [Pseudomonadota bacterium]
MTYLPYIIGAYAVFAVALAWDGLAPLFKYRRLLRAIRGRAARVASTKNDRRSA